MLDQSCGSSPQLNVCYEEGSEVPSAGKVLGTCFWDSDGIILIDYIPRGQALRGEYYIRLLEN